MTRTTIRKLFAVALFSLPMAALAPLAVAQTVTPANSTAKPQLVAVLIKTNRIEPPTVQVSPGRLMLLVRHDSARLSVTPQLSVQAGASIKSLSLSGPNSRGIIDVTLGSGTYILSEPGIPTATCKIVVK